MRNIRYGFDLLFRRLSKTVSIVFFIDFKSKLILVKIVSETVQESIDTVKVFIQLLS